MRFIIVVIYVLNVFEAKYMQDMRFENPNSDIFPLIGSIEEIGSQKFVLLPHYRHINETVSVHYKSFSKSSTLLVAQHWKLSIFVEQHFFAANQSNEPLQAVCYVEFSIERQRKEVGRNASCRMTVRAANFSATGDCIVKIGRPPAICSVTFDLSTLAANMDEWTAGSISAQLLMPSSAGLERVAVSDNVGAFVLNGRRPVNWTVVQKDVAFGHFAVGLPVASVRMGASFSLPLSISGLDSLQSVRMLVEYEPCLTLNSIDATDADRWDVRTNFERSSKGEIVVIRFTTRSRVMLGLTRTLWPELAVINFTVTDKKSINGCMMKAAISKTKSLDGKIEKLLYKDAFQTQQKSVSVPIDPDNMVMVAFQKPTNDSIPLLSTTKRDGRSTDIVTYMLHKTGDQYLPQLIHTYTCHYDAFTQGKSSESCVPQLVSNTYVLPIQIEQWRSVVFNVFASWRPESWKLHLSDSELNPIHGWRVQKQGRCVVMYQLAIVRVGVRLSTMNSFGLDTYLGSSLDNPRQWVDYSREVSLDQLSSNPPNVVKVSRNHMGRIVVTVNATRLTTLNLYSKKPTLLTSEPMSVQSVQWTSVVRFEGRCISDFDITRADSHPFGEGSFVNFEIITSKSRVGDKCHLYLGVVFNDRTQLMLEDLDQSDYLLEVNGIEFQNGNVITAQTQINVTLYESPMCKNSRVVFNGFVDLRGDLVEEKTNRSPITENVLGRHYSTTSNMGLIGVSVADQRNSLSIAIYCIVGVIGMVLVILVLNCLVGFNVRRHTLANIQRRLSKSSNHDGNNSRKDNVVPQVPAQEHYPPLLPPPGPIVSPSKPPTDWGVSSESGIGLERSSLGSQPDGVALSTFRVSIANGSIPPSDSSSYIHQTSPFSDIILESNNNSYTTEQSPQSFDNHPCLNQSYWSGISSPYRNVDHSLDPRSSSDLR